MRALLGLSLAAVALWPRTATAAPPEDQPAGRLQPRVQDSPWGAAPPSEGPAETPDAAQPQEPVSDPEQPAEQPEQANPPTEVDPPTEADPPSEAIPEAPAEPPKPVADPGDARPDAELAHQPLLAVEKKLGPKQIETTAAVYGFVMTNVVFLTGTVGPTGEAPAFALAGSTIGDGLPTDGQFLITARQSRLGFKGALQITERVDINGVIEFDFFGLHENEGPTSVLQPGIRLRLAKLDVGDARFRFIAGQDWSIVTPRLPTSLSHTVVAAHTW